MNLAQTYFCFKLTLFSTYWHTFQMQTLKNCYIDAGFALKKVFIDNQGQRKKLGTFFYFTFFSDRPTLQILKKICAPGN